MLLINQIVDVNPLPVRHRHDRRSTTDFTNRVIPFVQEVPKISIPYKTSHPQELGLGRKVQENPLTRRDQLLGRFTLF